jgi:hypothetical protein
VITAWQSSAADVELIQGDAIAYLGAFDFTGQELLYLDPPYLSSTRRKNRVYRHEFSDAQHERLLVIAASLPCMVMISGYTSDLYGSHLRNWNKVNFMANSQVGLREECVWFNFDPPSVLHDASHLGANFRERQTIKRRRERLYERIEGLNSVERHELMAWMTAKFGEARAL